MGKWGGQEICPGCDKTVYATERVYAADRKPFHPSCIRCQVRGCRNELTERGIHKHEGYNFCDRCHETLYDPKAYGVKPGAESLEEQRQRLAREKAEREAKERQMEELRARGPKTDDFELPGCFLRIAELVEISPQTSYSL